MKTRTLAVAAALGIGVIAPAQLRVQVHATGLSSPVAMTQDPTDASVQFVVEQRGLVRVLVNGVVQATNFINLTSLVNQSSSEGGLLGLAFHPNYNSNGFFYVNYVDSTNDTHIVRYTRSTGNPLVADPGSAHQVLFIDQPFSNHKGGTLRFGPMDNYLYIGMGDGGSANDPGNRAQTITNMLLGKVLRLDVDRDDFPLDPARNYGIPSTNPFVGVTGDDEIWSFGVRNPWKWSFDNPLHLGTGGMLMGDVGQGAWEEVNYERPLVGGKNYGWRVYEGNNLTGLGGGTGPYTFPIHVYGHGEGISITGGYVYRGLELGDYFGRYFFADYGSRKIWSFKLVIDPVTGEGSATDLIDHTADVNSGANLISSIDVDANGELYILDYRGSGLGRVLKLAPENRAWAKSIVPDLLTPVQGNIRTLSASDGKLLRTLQLESPTVSRFFQSAYFLNMATDMAAPSFFDVFVDLQASASIGAATLTVKIRNWTTGNLDSIGSFPVTTTLSTKQILGVPAANYRRSSDGAVQLHFHVGNPGAYSSDRLVINYDRVKLVPR